MLKFTHVRLLVNNFQDCLRFYRDVLGLEVGWNDDENYADLKTGETSIALNSRPGMADAIPGFRQPPASSQSEQIALIFAVEDVDVAYEQLSAKGVVFATAPQNREGWGIRTAHFRDPDGNLLEINGALK